MRNGENTGPPTSARTALHSMPKITPPIKLKPMRTERMTSSLRGWPGTYLLSFSLNLQRRDLAIRSQNNCCHRLRSPRTPMMLSLGLENGTVTTSYAAVCSTSFLRRLLSQFFCSSKTYRQVPQSPMGPFVESCLRHGGRDYQGVYKG